MSLETKSLFAKRCRSVLLKWEALCLVAYGDSGPS